jgi:D-glycero-D-manno-heptose 1,7-bisphosphate phosphatase
MLNNESEKPAIFLDRDGTLIEEVDFLSTVAETKLFPFTIEALKLFRDAGFLLFVTTNQSGIARGYFDERAVQAIHAKIGQEIEPAGLRIESFHFCPHLPDAGCLCRKPQTGMIEAACRNAAVDLTRSWVIGDKKLDVEMGFNAGTGAALVKTGYGRQHRRELARKPQIIAENLLAAAEMIVRKK